MKEAFDARLERETLRPLMARRDGPSVRRFGLQYSLLLGAGCLLLGDFGWRLQLGAGLVYALMLLPMFAVEHEAGHDTAFATKGLNRLVQWLAGLPMFYTPAGFRTFHFAHHRHTHDPERDPEISLGGRPLPAATSALPLYLVYFSGLPLMVFKFWLVAAAARGGDRVWTHMLTYVLPRHRRQVCREGRLALGFYLAFLLAGASGFPLGLLRLGAATWLGHGLLMTCLIAEHNGLPHRGEILARTRTTLTLAPLRWLMWNMPYHAEHHAYPAVPWHALPRLHGLLAAELRLQPGYGRLHRRILAALLRGQAFDDSRI